MHTFITYLHKPKHQVRFPLKRTSLTTENIFNAVPIYKLFANKL